MYTIEEFEKSMKKSLIGFAEFCIQNGDIAPHAFLVTTKKFETGEDLSEPEVIVIATLDEFDDGGKDVFVEAIKKMAERTGSIGAAFLSEAWLVSASSTMEAMKFGSLGNHPSKRDTVLITFDHIAYPIGTGKMLSAEITAVDGKRVIGEFTDFGLNKGSGRFCGLLDFAKNKNGATA